MPKKKPEKKIQSEILKYLNSLDKVRAFKYPAGPYSEVGIHDIICCYYGAFGTFEVKSEGGKATKLQLIFQRDILYCSGFSAIVFSLHDVKGVLNELTGKRIIIL